MNTLIRPVFAQAQGSPIREIMRHASEPDMLSLGGGYPAAECFDVAGIQAAFTAAATSLENSLQYGLTDGDLALRAQLAAMLMAQGVTATAEEILVLSGAQQGFDLLVRTLVEPGDRVLVESPTYPATLAALRLAQADVVEIPVDANGICPNRLRDALRHGRAKLLYTTPNYSNPTGATLDLARRRALVDIAAEYGVLVVEDDPYRDLGFNDTPLPTLSGIADRLGARHQICYLGSLSKIISPGLRLGYAILPSLIRRACVLAKQVGDLHTSRLSQSVASHYLASNRLPDHLPRVRETYARRAQALADALRQCFPADLLRINLPQGGMFLWAQFLDGTDTRALVDFAQQEKILFIPGECFLLRPVPSPFLRLSFSSVPPERMSLAAERLHRAWVRCSSETPPRPPRRPTST